MSTQLKCLYARRSVRHPKAARYAVSVLFLVAVGFSVSAPAITNTSPEWVALPAMRIIGTAPRSVLPLSKHEIRPEPAQAVTLRDGADLVADSPGAAVVRNGPLTGIVQLRGLQNERVKILVDGMTLTPACPNHMDPPLHYVAPSSLDSLTVLAGITPVSLGGDSLAGTVLVQSPAPRFATNQASVSYADAGVRYETGNRGLGFDGQVGAADQQASALYQGSWADAEDYRFRDGTVRATGHTTQQHTIRLGAQTQPGILTLEVGYGQTRDAGTPALPMDMIEDDSWRVRAAHTAELDWGRWEARGYYHAIDHLMDNFSLRPAGMMRMFSPAESRDFGGGLATEFPWADHQLGAGLDFHGLRFNAYQENVANGLRQDSLPDLSRDRVGGYLEWTSAWHPRWETQVGVRADGVFSDADDVRQAFPPSAADQAAFNAREHQEDDLNLDATVLARFHATSHFSLEAGFARKNRAPSPLERYLWTPLSASAGQADGRRYLGNLDLSSETSHQVGLTLMGHTTNGLVRVTPFYQWVGDYIQGTPIARTTPEGLPVLQFQNQDRVELYGVDLETRYDPLRSLGFRGTLSYVRGRNLSTGDNLYRIAPLRGTVSLEHRWGIYQGILQVVMADDQTEVSRYNNEPTTPGYALLNLRIQLAVHRHLELALALENVFDELYTDHLGGINRVAESDVGLGQRIPGRGRSLVTMVRGRF